MSGIQRLFEGITHPITLGAGGLLALLSIHQGGLVWAILATFWANAGSTFGTASITLFVGQEIGLPGWVISSAAAIAVTSGLAAVAKFLLNYWEGVEDRTE